MGDMEARQEQRNSVLEKALSTAVSIVDKTYLTTLDQMTVKEPSRAVLDTKVAQCGTFYHLKRLVVNREESFLDKLTTITNVVASNQSSLTTVLHSDGHTVEYYIGMISKNNRKKALQEERDAMFGAFSSAMEGNFAGSTLEQLTPTRVEQLQEKIFHKNLSHVDAISGIVSLRNREQHDLSGYVQGIENLTHALQGKSYTIIMVADPINTMQIQTMKQGYEMLYTQLSNFGQSSITYSQTDSITLSQSESESISESITEGISRTQSHGTSQSISNGVNAGVSVGGLIGPVLVGGTVGRSRNKTQGSSQNQSHSTNQSHSNQSSSQTGSSTADMKGSGTSLQISGENRSVKGLLEKINRQIQRLELCESFGAFDCGTYVLTQNKGDAMAVSSHYNALMRGEDSFVQSSHINHWWKNTLPVLKSSGTPAYQGVMTYLKSFTHPQFLLDDSSKITFTPACQISGKELAIQFGLPKRSINGLPVLEMTPFGRNPEASTGKFIPLGDLYFMGQRTPTSVNLDIQSLASHTFITGSTGSGKSNTIYHMVDCLAKEDVSFMVIEPAKGEYKQVFGGRKDVTVYGTNPTHAALLRINPFSFPEDIHILEHIDRLVEIFNACWPMYAAMPAVLKDAIEQTYVKRGWSLSASTSASGTFPTFYDLLIELPLVMEQSSYSADTKGDYIGALVTRVKSLTNGINGQVFCGLDELSNQALFDQNTIVDLSRVGSNETKALIMGLLVMKLQEYRMCEPSMNHKLKHVTILEEAHNLLRRTSSEQSQEGSNLQGKSVEMLANAIAEMRTYGEGFIIADQSPGLLDLSVIRNTNTKIIMRVPDYSDRELVGRSIGLTDSQIVELSKLECGVGAVYQNNWLESVLCKIKHFTKQQPHRHCSATIQEEFEQEKLFARIIYGVTEGERNIEEVDSLKRWIDMLAVGAYVKNRLLDVLLGNDFIRDEEKGYFFYCLLKGKALCQQAENLYPAQGIPAFLDQEIMDRLHVSEELAIRIRLSLLGYISQIPGVERAFIDKIERFGGVM